MATLVLDFVQYPSFTREYILEGKTYIFKFTWNSRGEFWVMSISDIDKVAAVSGIKLVLNYDVLQDYHYLPVPPGQLFVYDKSDNTAKIAYEDFTNDRALILVYNESV